MSILKRFKNWLAEDAIYGGTASKAAVEAPSPRFKYADYVHKVIRIDKNIKTVSELTTWSPDIIQFLIDKKIISGAPEEGGQIRIIIKKYESDGTEPWNN